VDMKKKKDLTERLSAVTKGNVSQSMLCPSLY
jgi:hypothetical protein